jgi:lysophospholipase L1-like esterase
LLHLVCDFNYFSFSHIFLTILIRSFFPVGSAGEAFFSADLMHPNEEGYDWWARSLADQIHQQLSQGSGDASQ